MRYFGKDGYIGGVDGKIAAVTGFLKAGKHTLNESLSDILYQQIKEWYYNDFNEKITFAKCREIIVEFGFEISWIIDKNIEHGCVNTLFYVASENYEIFNRKRIPAVMFDLYIMLSAVPSENDDCLKSILGSDTMQN